MRTVDRVISFVMALALLVLGVLIPVEVVRTRLLDRPGHLLLPFEQLSSTLHSTQWRSSGVLVSSAAIALTGLILLLVELKPRRAWLLTMAGSDRGLVTVISRRSAARTLTRAAVGVERVSDARTTVTRRRATVTARTSSPDAKGVTEQLSQRLEQAVAELDLVRPPRTRVRLRRDPHHPHT